MTCDGNTYKKDKQKFEGIFSNSISNTNIKMISNTKTNANSSKISNSNTNSKISIIRVRIEYEYRLFDIQYSNFRICLVCVRPQNLTDQSEKCINSRDKCPSIDWPTTYEYYTASHIN